MYLDTFQPAEALVLAGYDRDVAALEPLFVKVKATAIALMYCT